MVQSGANLFNVDHMVDIHKACEVYSQADKAFKGNLDPVSDLLQASPEQCYELAGRLIKIAKDKKYMLSAGCEVPAAVSNETFGAFCRAASDS